ncbi:hypothetical protein NE237_001344 [Protea cynaroides]|uniref:F-box domain-containing protein n=1 Tax=Protea cynaroides TaxID=273540 RepID=A0A9Q0KSX9_9MAGN|nr:hypothetical protein NE237_001344 [Protea cynaroides]
MTSRNFAVFMREMASSSSSNKKKKMVKDSTWSGLPNHITEMIVDHLGFLDILRFGSVCHSWRSVYTQARRRRRFQPMVLFEYNLRKGTFGFFSFEDKKVNWIDIKGRHPAIHCAGSCESWLVLSSPSHYNYFLLNPFTGARVDFPYLNRHGVDNFTKVILLDSPIDITTKKTNYNCHVVALNLFSTELNVCRLGDAKWNVMELGHEHFLGSLVYFKNQIYTLSTNGELWIIGLFGPKLRATAHTRRVLIDLTIGPDIQKECYLVESEENLFMVVRIKRISLRKTVRFFIYKLVQNPGDYRWRREDNLPDDQALFLGRFCSKLVSITEYGGLQGNSIYFSDDKLLQKTRVPEYPETGIYNVRSGSITPCLPFDLYPFDLPHIWITPSV